MHGSGSGFVCHGSSSDSAVCHRSVSWCAIDNGSISNSVVCQCSIIGSAAYYWFCCLLLVLLPISVLLVVQFVSPFYCFPPQFCSDSAERYSFTSDLLCAIVVYCVQRLYYWFCCKPWFYQSTMLLPVTSCGVVIPLYVTVL